MFKACTLTNQLPSCTRTSRGVHPPKPMIHIAYSCYFHKIYKFSPRFRIIYEFLPISAKFTFFCLIYVFCLSRILIMMHLCIVLYTYWTSLKASECDCPTYTQ